MHPIEALLERFGAPGAEDVQLWIALVDELRPRRARDSGEAVAKLIHLQGLLNDRPELAVRLREALASLFDHHRQISLYLSSGLLPSTGFFTEMARRLSERWLPALIDTGHLKDLLGVIFHRRDDERWVSGVPDEIWGALLHTLLAAGDGKREMPQGVTEITEALRMLSYHVAALGLDPEMGHINPALEHFPSPFLTQSSELNLWLDRYHACRGQADELPPGLERSKQLLEECREAMAEIRQLAARNGTSLTLNFKLERLDQHLTRMGRLLDLLEPLAGNRQEAVPHMVALFKELVRAECRKNDLSDYAGKHLELLSLRVTENAGNAGEHYITSGRDDYFAMLRSAAGAGFIIALMAAIKLILGRQGFPPLNETLTICLNYAIGFVVIHMLHLTVATKQPAMTAHAIAAAIEAKEGRSHDLEKLAELIVRTIRSQLAAVVGNVGVAVPVAMVVGLAVYLLSGEQFVTPAEAEHLLHAVDPFGATLVYAAIAGVCLFIAGLVAGYYDNLCVYNRIPQRLLQLRWPQRILGATRMQRVARYVENNLGALAGNFAFGFMLGGVWGLGMLTGLPLDIRHIAFSSAHLGYALVGLEFGPALSVVATAAAGVLAIGAVNLLVSFSLALMVALRARNVAFSQGWRLGWLLLRRLFTRPREFLLPPRPVTRSEEQSAPST